MKALLFAVLLVGCEAKTHAPPAKPPPIKPGPVTCVELCAHVEELGGCGMAPGECGIVCPKRAARDAKLGLVFPIDCMHAADSCESMARCE